MRPIGHCVHPVSLGSLARALEVIRFTRRRPGGHWVHPGSLNRILGVVEFIQGHWVCSHATWISFNSAGVVGFIHACLGCRWVHPGSLGSHAHLLRVVGYILCRWVH